MKKIPLYLSKFSHDLYFLCLFFFLALSPIIAGTNDSGGPILPEQEAYDVTFYDINLKIDPSDKSISGCTIVNASVISSISQFVLHLNSNYNISGIEGGINGASASLNFSHSWGLVKISLPASQGDLISIKINYSGIPSTPGGLPWNCGFAWSKTQSGQNWIGMACEEEGADVWIPCKDHPSDEADSVAINLTVPADLVCVSNGVERGVTNVDANWKTFHWFVNNPINNYNLTFYAAPYEKLKFDYTSITGELMPMYFWALPENKTAAQAHGKELLKYVQAMEELCGPFPFRADKLAYVYSNYWGMEHQSAIAYGHDFSVDQFGIDYIGMHELAHEWWGNLVTAKNWRDAWIHEGFGTYMEALCAEILGDNNSYHQYFSHIFDPNSLYPVVPAGDVTAAQIFSGNHNIYHKGATVLHNLRFLMGDEKMFQFIRRCAYPDPAKENVTDGSQCRLATTEEIIEIANEIAGENLTWYFDTVLRDYTPPRLSANWYGGTLKLKWTTDNQPEYNMPVEIKVGDIIHKVMFSGGIGILELGERQTIVIDPNKWLLKEFYVPVGIEDQTDLPGAFELGSYPNPFNPAAIIHFKLSEISEVSIEIFNTAGELIATLADKQFAAGEHKITWNAEKFASGIYFCCLEINKDRKERHRETLKLVLQK